MDHPLYLPEMGRAWRAVPVQAFSWPPVSVPVDLGGETNCTIAVAHVLIYLSIFPYSEFNFFASNFSLDDLLSCPRAMRPARPHRPEPIAKRCRIPHGEALEMLRAVCEELALSLR